MCAQRVFRKVFVNLLKLLKNILPFQHRMELSGAAPSTSAPEGCGVCGAPAKCFGFTVQVCKACSVFYRRNWRLAKTSKCRRNGKCDLGHGQFSDFSLPIELL